LFYDIYNIDVLFEKIKLKVIFFWKSSPTFSGRRAGFIYFT